LRTSTIGLAHGDLDFRIIPCLSICSITNFSSLAKANGPVLSEEDETEIENLNTLRRLQFDKNDCKTQMNKHSELEKVVADVQRKRPEPKPNISETFPVTFFNKSTKLAAITNGDFSIKQGEGSIRNSRAEHKPSIWSIST
jgi:hypothetical protein